MTRPTPRTPKQALKEPDFSAGAGFAKITDDPTTVNEVEVVKPAPKRKPLKQRDLKFIEAKAKEPDLPDYKAAMAATGTTDMNVASTQAARMLQNVTLREALQDALTNQGFTIDDGAKALVDALQAHKTAPGVVVMDSTEEGESKVVTGLVETDIPDHGIRISAAKAIFSFLADKNEPAGGGNTFNFIGQNTFVKKDAA